MFFDKFQVSCSRNNQKRPTWKYKYYNSGDMCIIN